MNVLWLSDRIEGGGAERYVRATPPLLRSGGVVSTLLYGVEQRMTAELASGFDGVFPMVDVARQIRELAPDLVYVHKVSSDVARVVASTGLRVARFVHDHAMFCLREHKYTAIGSEPCKRTVGPSCYACTGFVRRDPRSRRLALATLDPLREAWSVLATHEAVVVGSRYMADHVIAHGLSEDRVHVVPLYGPEPRAVCESTREPGEVLFVGALTTGKGVDVLLHAAAISPGIRKLHIIGDGPQRSELERLSTSLGLRERVIFAGALSPSAIGEHYARAACLALPSRQPETFGLVGVEAMAHGIPVVTTAIGGTAEWLAYDRTGLAVPANNPQELGAAIERVLDPALGARLGGAARRTYAARFCPQHHVDRLKRVFQLALEARRAA